MFYRVLLFLISILLCISTQPASAEDFSLLEEIVLADTNNTSGNFCLHCQLATIHYCETTYEPGSIREYICLCLGYQACALHPECKGDEVWATLFCGFLAGLHIRLGYAE